MMTEVPPFADTPSSPTLQRLEDRCEILHSCKIGVGRHSEVILCTDRFTKEPVAVKILARGVGCKEAQNWTEVEALRRIKHPNIVRLIDALVSTSWLPGVKEPPPHLCIAMEYVAGCQLSRIIREGGAQPLLARRLLPQLADALAETHCQGFVHRDIWSENILVKDGHTAVLVDWGCAADFARGPTVENRMNVPYMSPEASEGQRQKPSDDSWALGCLLTEVITGKFIADQTGTMRQPLHNFPDCMRRIIINTQEGGGPFLGRLASMLLDPVAETRLQMHDLVDLCRKDGTWTMTASTSVYPWTQAASGTLLAQQAFSPRKRACSPYRSGTTPLSLRSDISTMSGGSFGLPMTPTAATVLTRSSSNTALSNTPSGNDFKVARDFEAHIVGELGQPVAPARQTLKNFSESLRLNLGKIWQDPGGAVRGESSTRGACSPSHAVFPIPSSPRHELIRHGNHIQTGPTLPPSPCYSPFAPATARPAVLRLPARPNRSQSASAPERQIRSRSAFAAPVAVFHVDTSCFRPQARVQVHPPARSPRRPETPAAVGCSSVPLPCKAASGTTAPLVTPRQGLSSGPAAWTRPAVAHGDVAAHVAFPKVPSSNSLTHGPALFHRRIPAQPPFSIQRPPVAVFTCPHSST